MNSVFGIEAHTVGRVAMGEMGLLEKRPRSAEVVADADVEAYLLTEEGFEVYSARTPAHRARLAGQHRAATRAPSAQYVG